MNSLLKEQFRFFKYYSKTTVFTIVVLFCCLASVFFGVILGINVGEYTTYSELVTIILGNGKYFFLLLIIFLFNTYSLYKGIVKSDFLKMRLQNNKLFFRKMMTTIAFQTAIIFLINLLIILICINIFASPKHGIYFLEKRSTYDILYMLFYITRYLIWIEMFSIFQIWLFSRFSEKGTIVINLMYFVYIFFYASILPSDYIISSFSDITINVSYFLIPAYYSSFFYEILISLTYICLLFLLVKALFVIQINHNKIGVFFTNIKNDIVEIICLEWKKLIGYFLIIFLLFAYFIIIKEGIINISFFKNVIGFNYRESKYVLELFILLFYQMFIAYLSIKFLSKNIEMQACTIFLRMRPKQFLMQKLVSLGVVSCFIKVLSYVFLYMLFMFTSSVSYSQIIDLFVIDLIFTLTIQVFNITCFIIYYSFSKIRFIILPMIGFEFYILSLSILDLSRLLLIIIIVIETYFISKVFEKRFCFIFEEIEKGE